MTQIVHTWTFDSDSEGLTDHGDSANVAFSFISGDGSPSSGCVKFANTAFNGSETARSASGHNWTYWGVPAGVNVTAVQITAYKAKVNKGGHDSPPSFSADIISGSTVVHAAGSLFFAQPNATTWAAQAAGTDRSVDSAYQAAATSVQLRLSYTGVGGQAAFIDTLELTITHDGGANDYSDTVSSTGAGLSVLSEVLSGADTVSARGAGRSATVEVLRTADTLSATGAGLTATDEIGLNTLNARGAGLIAGIDGPHHFRDTLSAVGAGRSVVAEEVPTFTPRVYRDYLNAVAAGKGAATEVQRGRDTLLSIGAGKGSIAANILHGTAILSATGAGRGAVTASALSHAETLSAVGAGRAGHADCLEPFAFFTFGMRSIASALFFGLSGGGCPASGSVLRVKESLNARGAGLSAASELLTARQTLSAKGAGLSAASEVLTASAVLSARGAGKAAGLNTLHASGVLSAVGAGLPGTAPCIDAFSFFTFGLDSLAALLLFGLTTGTCLSGGSQFRGRDSLNARGAGLAAGTEQRHTADVLNAKGAGKSATSEAPVHSIDAVLSTTGAGRSDVTEISVFTVDDLIRTLRALAHRILPEIKAVPEGLSEGQFVATLPLDYLVIVAMEPREDETAVFSNAMWVPVDFVYIAKNKANRDNPAYVRSRLNLYADAILRDYKLASVSGSPVVNTSDITATPYNRLNSYQQAMSEAAQSVSVMALTGEFRLVHDVTNS